MPFNLRINLRVGIAFAFGMVMITLTVALIGYLYWNNTKLMVSTISEIMQRSSKTISRDVQGLIAPVSQLVSASTELVKNDQGFLQTVQGLGYFHRQLKSLPQVYSTYVGYSGEGDFYQVFNLPPSLKSLGPSKNPLPEEARSAVRILDNSSGKRADSFIFYKEWGDVLAVDRGPARYDPRKRPWYKLSWEQPGTSISKAYVFSSSGLVGLTVSHRVATSNGIPIGTVGADITLDTISGFLKKARIGKEGRVFIINGDGQLVAHPDPNMAVKSEAGKLKLVKATEALDPFVVDAVNAYKKKGEKQFEASLGPHDDAYLVAFTPFESGPDWTVGVMVRKDELTGPLEESSVEILIAGLAAIAIALLTFGALSRLLTGPLQKIVQETHKIQAFDLSGRLEAKSVINEVHQLTTAVQTMKRSLRSFSVYVPKEIVRVIVSENSDASIGSRRQQLTVMFSDIAGFSKITEGLPPEQLVSSLSEYFEQMSQQIHQTEGTVDKFIGDAIMAMWNAPIPDANHVVHGCEAMLRCHQAGLLLAEQFKERNFDPFYTRIGLHTGEAVVGNVGSQDRMQYSSFGNTINLAARLESMNKYYGTYLLVSEQVEQQAAEQFHFRHLDKVVAVGTTQPMNIYELVGAKDPHSPVAITAEQLSRLQSWEEAMALYETRQWDAAAAAFARFQKHYPDDKCAEMLIKRCQEYTTLPPPSDWDGAQWLKSK
uniref:Putative adenylate/guanylate cyclase n=1 Tax=Magnetococcus massalia (strain MO-1) TaxID=451514 RepID=A0A1S7LNF9_MAGMO|nr:Putative adenylate/guanylate cyclase [Candidatus Magnetococcus massalia]